MSMHERDEIKEKMDDAADRFMHVVNTASSGCAGAVLRVIHADKPDLVKLHIRLEKQNPDYRAAFNAYSKATKSEAGKALERKVHVASSEQSAFLKLGKIFTAAASHLPTYVTILRSEQKMEKIFRQNYRPKM